MIDQFNLLISGTALFVSLVTAWFTLLRRGALRMTRPSIVCFAFDLEEQKVIPKVFLRTLLYSTSQRGLVVENLFVRLRRGNSTQTFSTWGHQAKELVFGSGLFVGSNGLSYYHHFLLPRNANNFEFSSGDYVIQVFASLVGRKRPLKLSELSVSLTENQAKALQTHSSDIAFEWEPESRKYISHLRGNPERILDRRFF